MLGFFSKDRIVAEPGFNRWRVPPASIAIHLCIGSVYAWSIFNTPLQRAHGVVISSSDDWTLAQVVRTFTVAIICLGLSAAVAGKWIERVGPRTVGIVAAICWGSGFLIAALGIHLHQLWLVYFGYGVVGGCGLGLGYVSPVSTLIRWFPDRRGMATGMAIMGFGGGALVGTPLIKTLLNVFYRAPQYLGVEGTVADVTTNAAGVQFVELAGQLHEVVVLSTQEALVRAGSPPAGLYVVGTGNSGAAATFVALGIGYFFVMLVAALFYRIPAPDWKPQGWAPPDERLSTRKMISTAVVGISAATRTPQFSLLWIVLCFNVTAGIGILGVAKTMMVEIFGDTLREKQISVDGFAEVFVLMTSLANLGGRFFWASVSDHVGRKTTYTVFFVAGIALYLSIPWTAHRTGLSSDVTPLVLFYAATMLIFTMYGGGFATIPAYLADLFGSKFVGGIHGRLLTAWSIAGLLGPFALTSLRERAVGHALHRLAAAVDPQQFIERFHVSAENLDALIAAKTVTIPKLMEIAPPGTIDPTATVYNSTMFLMAALLAVALVANLLVRPVDARHHERAGS
ncbi:MAG: OFA family MFS transporter [Planctomycetia bacterium]|nr:OFA family MFS transporter [Planctomycetia bacterium]